MRCSRRWACNEVIAGVKTSDAVADLGRLEEIGHVFAGFQKYLYQEQTAA